MTDIWEMRKNILEPNWQHISERPEIMKRTAKRWTEEENDRLIELKRDGVSHRGIANALNEMFNNNRTPSSIDVKIGKLHNNGVDLDIKAYWSDEETEMLIHLHKTNESRPSIVTILNSAFSNDRTTAAIGAKIHHLGLSNPTKCSYCKEYGHNKRTCGAFKEHLELIKSNDAIVEVIEEVVEEMEEEYIELARSSRKRWTAPEEGYMVKLAYEGMPYSEITKKVNDEFNTGRSASAVISRLSLLHTGHLKYFYQKSWRNSWKERILNRKEKRIQKKILRIQNKIAKLQSKISKLGAKL